MGKLRLDQLPLGFNLVSASPDEREAVISYGQITPPHKLINELMHATEARNVGVITPYEANSMNFFVSAKRGPTADSTPRDPDI